LLYCHKMNTKWKPAWCVFFSHLFELLSNLCVRSFLRMQLWHIQVRNSLRILCIQIWVLQAAAAWRLERALECGGWWERGFLIGLVIVRSVAARRGSCAFLLALAVAARIKQVRWINMCTYGWGRSTNYIYYINQLNITAQPCYPRHYYISNP
jgi:hypothetical protein